MANSRRLFLSKWREDFSLHFRVKGCYRKVLLTGAFPIHAAELGHLVNQLVYNSYCQSCWFGRPDTQLHREMKVLYWKIRIFSVSYIIERQKLIESHTRKYISCRHIFMANTTQDIQYGLQFFLTWNFPVKVYNYLTNGLVLLSKFFTEFLYNQLAVGFDSCGDS